MIIDPSAISAILFGEVEGQAFLQALAELMATSGIDTVPFDTGQAELALDAWRRYGIGRHPAGLNLGDCAAYALARFTGEPLLYKGDDFPKTYVAKAVYPV